MCKDGHYPTKLGTTEISAGVPATVGTNQCNALDVFTSCAAASKSIAGGQCERCATGYYPTAYNTDGSDPGTGTNVCTAVDGSAALN